MRRRAAPVVLSLCLLFLLAACPDNTRVNTISPQLEVGAASLPFGTVQVGESADLAVTLAARSRSAVSLVSLSVADAPGEPGGASAFLLPEPPDSVEGDSEVELTVRFSPPKEGDFAAALRIESDDPDPEDAVRVLPLTGRGAVPVLKIAPTCAPPCQGFTVVADPPAVDFGPRNALRTDSGGRVVNEPPWPTVTFSNEGEVPLDVAKAEFAGSPGFRAKPALDLAGMVLGPGEKRSYRLVFDPQDEAPTPYSADLVVESDDPAWPRAKLHLQGTLAPNKAPGVCAGIVEVLQPDGTTDMPRDPATNQTTFGGKIAVEPSDHTLVKLSAFSDHFAAGLHPNEASLGDYALCTSDYEDGREPLEWQWTLREKPAHSVATLSGPTGPEVSLQPEAYGRYTLGLSVADPGGATTSTEVSFTALPARDIAAELTWDTPGVDLDLHLVKPGACGGQPGCFFQRTGDASAYTLLKAGGVFDWGEQGKGWDDPRVDTRDAGDKGLVESVSLSRPESDPSCADAPCPYEVYVHFMRDSRSTSTTAPACPARPCREGEACGCSGGNVCVAGRCVSKVAVQVRLYVQPSATRPSSVLSLPLSSETIALAGPCFAWRVGTLTWPSKKDVQTDPDAQVTVSAAGSAGARPFLFYGRLPVDSFACQPNTPSGTPDEDVTYLPGQAPTYP